LTHSGRLTHEVVTRQPWIRRRSGKVRRLRTDVLTTEPRRHAGNPFQLGLQKLSPFCISEVHWCHWLDIPQSVPYKLGVTVHRCLQEKAPQYRMDCSMRTSTSQAVNAFDRPTVTSW